MPLQLCLEATGTSLHLLGEIAELTRVSLLPLQLRQALLEHAVFPHALVPEYVSFLRQTINQLPLEVSLMILHACSPYLPK